MMTVNEGTLNGDPVHLFECTDCDACLPCKRKTTADALMVSHPATPHHQLMASLSEVNDDVATS